MDFYVLDASAVPLSRIYFTEFYWKTRCGAAWPKTYILSTRNRGFHYHVTSLSVMCIIDESKRRTKNHAASTAAFFGRYDRRGSYTPECRESLVIRQQHCHQSNRLLWVAPAKDTRTTAAGIGRVGSYFFFLLSRNITVIAYERRIPIYTISLA
jgi:hypothetical protein